MSGTTMRAISSRATRHLLSDLVEAAVLAGLPLVEVTSVGGVDAAQRVAAGDPYDLVVLAEDAVARLGEAGKVDGRLARPLARSQVAVGVRSDASDPRPSAHPVGAAFASGDELRSALQSAGRIGYSTGPSGTALTRLIEELDISDEVAGRLVQARPGEPVAALLLRGEADIGFQQLSELAGEPGVRLLGVMPPELALESIFAGAVVTSAADPAAAQSVLDFWASDAVTSIKLKHGFGAPGDDHEG